MIDNEVQAERIIVLLNSFDKVYSQRNDEKKNDVFSNDRITSGRWAVLV